MLKATQDFRYASIDIKAGQEITPGLFEADQVASLLRKGWIEYDSPAMKVEPKKAVKSTVSKRSKKAATKK